jgi:FlaA1/EpsC-like NDP-sugar epimerase
MSGQQLAASIRQEPSLYVVGFVDSNETLRGSMLEGKRIWHTSDLEQVLVEESIEEVLLALPSARRSQRRAIVEQIQQHRPGVRVRVLPSFSQLASGRVSINDLREVQVEELLGRDEVAPDPELMQRNIGGLRVLVTGAGGSIGSELSRQILRQQPSAIILAEQSEHALYTIDIELRETVGREGLSTEIVPELVNVADERQCERMLRRYAVDTVFHAAAYKHVPLVESNPVAGIRNNVLSTFNTALASERCGVAKFILVSTDKAVRPTNVMGASKRACELIVQARAAAQQETSYCSVRFGNVLGSSGSVIPRFREQIAKGGPVTITNREATRYFMTIPEAAQLVIQAGALARDGEVLLLDMGEPVRIVDLARLMIELSGLTIADEQSPEGEIAIEEIGLRPGEKLVEELLICGDCEGTDHPRIVKARETMLPWAALEPQLRTLISLLDEGDTALAIEALQALVPEFRSLDGPGADVHPRPSRVLKEVAGGS